MVVNRTIAWRSGSSPRPPEPRQHVLRLGDVVPRARLPLRGNAGQLLFRERASEADYRARQLVRDVRFCDLATNFTVCLLPDFNCSKSIAELKQTRHMSTFMHRCGKSFGCGMS